MIQNEMQDRDVKPAPVTTMLNQNPGVVSNEIKSLIATPSSPTGPQPKSKALALAAGLIDQSRNAGDVAVDELVSLPVRKPNKGQFFRIHPTLHADVNLFKIESSSGTETYAVYPDMVGMLDGIQLYTLFLGIHRDGSCFLWPISATSSDGWSRSGRQIAIAAMEKWVRLVADRSANTYMKRVANNFNDDAQFPANKTFEELLSLAFGDGRIIDTADHHIVKEHWL